MRSSGLSGLRRAVSPEGAAFRLAFSVVSSLVALGAMLTPALTPATRAARVDAPAETAVPGQAPPRVDARLAPLGRAYLPALGRTYAAAWIEGAKALEAGQSVDAALHVVGRSWDSGRQALFHRVVAPQFSRIVPDGQPDAATDPARKQALAAAWRGFARGLDAGRSERAVSGRSVIGSPEGFAVVDLDGQGGRDEASSTR
jgi:hypothetical protein